MLYSLVVAPCFIALVWFCWYMDRRHIARQPESIACAAMNATTARMKLQKEKKWLYMDDYLDWKRDFEIDVELAKLEKIIEAGLPKKKDPYLEYGEAEVEMICASGDIRSYTPGPGKPRSALSPDYVEGHEMGSHPGDCRGRCCSGEMGS